MKTLIGIGCIILGFVILFGLSMLYEIIKVKLNKPKIGFKPLIYSLLKRSDYICIAGNVMQFSHWTQSGEVIDVLRPPLDGNQVIYDDDIACYSPNRLGYIYYPFESLNNMQFIYGKYGVKWAKSKGWAEKASKLVEDYWK